uniref:SUN domain-containing protein 1-like n=1 Tax=Erigeron canadensis TaxID=72917 RepID=UPI001CB8E5D8|nr:SUN domain-containing protein 1-like [Erigeron canadensis]
MTVDAISSPVSRRKSTTAVEKPKSRSPRTRTTPKKSHPKPLWKTILSIFIKNSILLLILILLVKMVTKFASFNTNDLSYYSYEKRFEEMDVFLKTTTKMIQNRVDFIDQKISKETDGLKTELVNRIDDNRAEFTARFQELGQKVVKKSEISHLVTKDEFGMFLDHEFKNGFKGGFGDSIKLDKVKQFAKEIVENEIEKHSADGIGRVDYAAASGGGKIVSHSDCFYRKVFDKLKWKNRVSGDAVNMLQPSFGEPGQCFPLKGNNGFVEIKLRTAIIPEAITLEHVAKSVAFDRSTAPKDCRVFGWLHNKGSEQIQLLTEFVYDLEKSSAQTFNVLYTGGSSIIDTIRLDFTSNHGNPEHTCIYRLRVHGQEPHSLSSLALQS